MAIEIVDLAIENGDFPYFFVCLRPNTLICPRFSAAIFRRAENVVKMGVFCMTGNLKLFISTHRSLTCARLLHSNIIIININIIIIINNININININISLIFPKYRCWSSQLNVKFNGGGSLIFPKYPCWSSQLNVKFNGGGSLIFSKTFVDLPNWM